MAKLNLSVPLVPQRLGFSCWYAAACMVNYYFSPGPRLGLPKVWHGDQGLSSRIVSDLAKAEKLTSLQAKDHDFTAPSLLNTLLKSGPIWAGMTWKGGHVVVITGCSSDDGGTVYYNDPSPKDQGQRATTSIAEFNAGRARGFLLVADRGQSTSVHSPLGIPASFLKQ